MKNESLEQNFDTIIEKTTEEVVIPSQRHDIKKSEIIDDSARVKKIKKIRVDLGIDKKKESNSAEKTETIIKLPPDIETIFSDNDKWKKKRLFSNIRKFTGIGLVAFSTFWGKSEFQKFQHEKKENEIVEMVNKDIGFNIKDLAEIENVKVEVEIYSPDSKQYLIHLGQMHYVEGIPLGIDETLRSQKKIENILKLIYHKNEGVTNIFTEGITERSLESLSIVKKNIDEIDSLELNEDIYKNIYEILSKWFDTYKGKPDKAIMIYTINKKLESLKNFQMNPNQKTEFDHYKKLVEDLVKNPVFLNNKDDVYYYLGADFKDFIDGNINLLPSEGKTRMQDMDKKIPIEEQNQNIREEETTEIVMNNKITKTQKIIPLVFGDKHDFSDNVREYNSLHPDAKLNLIKISTIDQNE